jgi:serine/threonine-protein kinase
MADSFGQYRVLEPLGDVDGVGPSYRTRDTRAGRTVIVTTLSPGMPAGRRARILERARAVAGWSHPGLATLYEVSEDHGLAYLAFEFVGGKPLRAIIGGQPIHPRRAVDFAAQMADALAEAHARGVTHGRLSPESVIVTPRGHVKIVNVGLAEVMDSAPAARATAQQRDDEGERADVAALAATLAEMLNGAPLEPGGATRIPAHIPPELADVVGRGLAASDPDRVPRALTSAAALAAELRIVAAGFEDRVDAPAAPPTRISGERPGVLWAWLLALAGLAAVVALVWLALRAG